MKFRKLRTHLCTLAAGLLVALGLMSTAQAKLPTQEDFDAAVSAFSEFAEGAKANLETLAQ